MTDNRIEKRGRGFRPAFAFDKAIDISPSFFQVRGVRGVVLDIDNTVTRWELHELPVELKSWIDSLKGAGLKLVLLSNGMPSKIRAVEDASGVTAVRGIKPLMSSFIRARNFLELPDREIAIVGDQCITDILPANRLGWLTVLVEPMSHRDFPGTRIFRLLERAFGLRRPMNSG